MRTSHLVAGFAAGFAVILSLGAGGQIGPVGDIFGVFPANDGGLEGGSASGTAYLGLRTDCPGTSEILYWDGGKWDCAPMPAGGSGISGLTPNALPKATSSTTIGDSRIIDNGTTLTSCSGLACAWTHTGAFGASTVTDNGNRVFSLAGAGLSTPSAGTVGLQTCTTNQILKHNGTTWACAADTTYTPSGTSGRSTRYSSASALGTGAFVDDGTNVTLAGTATLNGNTVIGDSFVNDSFTINARSAVVGPITPTYSQFKVGSTTGVLSFLGYAADNAGVGFDIEYFNNIWTSRSTSFAFINKGAGSIAMYGASGVATNTNVTSSVVSSAANPQFKITFATNMVDVINFAASGSLSNAGNVDLSTNTANTIAMRGTTTFYGSTAQTTFEGGVKVSGTLRNPNVATISSCGTSPTIKGGAIGGNFTTGSGATACTVTLPTAVDTYSCVISSRSTSKAFTYAPTSTGFTIGTAAPSNTYDYICVDNN